MHVFGKLVIIFISASFYCFVSCYGRSIAPSSIPFEDCGSVYDVMQVYISSCTSVPCKIPVNETVRLKAEFASFGYDYRATGILNHSAIWTINAIATKALITPDHCDGLSCPFQTTDNLAFEADLVVNPNFPLIRGNLQWRVNDDDGKLVMCFKIPISLVRSDLA